MKNIVIYSSKSRNSELVAINIAKELKCKLVNLDEVEFKDIDLKETDTIFLGSGVYGGKLHEKIVTFAKLLNSYISNNNSPRKIAFFITWLGRGKSDLSAINHCKRFLESKDIDTQDDYFKCFGESFKLIRKGHPDESDIKNAKEWAKKMTGSI